MVTKTYLDNDQARLISHYQVELTEATGEVSVNWGQSLLVEISKRKILSVVA